MPRRHLQLAVVFTVSALVGCHECRYSGDGKLTDDLFSSSQRFVLTLGSIDLARSGTATFRLADLPEKQFTLGFQVSGPRPASDALYDSRPISAVVRVTLVDERRRVIIDESAALNDWVWSGSPHENTSFVYRQSSSRDVPIDSGFVRPEPIGEKPDGGWGSYFTPRGDGKYTLTIQVLKADVAAARYDVVVRAVTGGWE